MQEPVVLGIIWHKSLLAIWGKPNTDVATRKSRHRKTAQSEKEKARFITLDAKTGEIHAEATDTTDQVGSSRRPLQAA
jgi:hypothetical protein